MNGIETHNFSTRKSYPTACLSSWFLFPSLSLVYLRNLMCSSASQSNKQFFWLVQGKEDANPEQLLKSMDFILCGLAIFILVSLSVSGWERPLSDWSWFPFASLSTRIAHRWLQVTIPVGEHTTAVSLQSAPAGSLIHSDYSVIHFPCSIIYSYFLCCIVTKPLLFDLYGGWCCCS